MTVSVYRIPIAAKRRPGVVQHNREGCNKTWDDNAMYYANSHIHSPKKKVPCSFVTTDGETLEGSFFLSGDQRIKDMLNGDNEFVAFETMGGAIYLLNRNSIARVTPREVAVAKPNGAHVVEGIVPT